MGAGRVALALALVGQLARATEAPPAGPPPACHREGSTVVCDAEGFRLLTEAVLEARTNAKLCGAQLEAAQGRLVDARAAVVACTAAPVPEAVPPAPPVRPSATWPLLGLAAGVVGAMGLAAAVTAPWPDGGRYLTGGAGLALLGLGVALVVP